MGTFAQVTEIHRYRGGIIHVLLAAHRRYAVPSNVQVTLSLSLSLSLSLLSLSPFLYQFCFQSYALVCFVVNLCVCVLCFVRVCMPVFNLCMRLVTLPLSYHMQLIPPPLSLSLSLSSSLS